MFSCMGIMRTNEYICIYIYTYIWIFRYRFRFSIFGLDIDIDLDLGKNLDTWIDTSFPVSYSKHVFVHSCS